NNSSLIFSRSNTVTQGTDFSASAISGTGTLTQAGTGALVLSAANTYTGATSVNAGAISISSDSNLGTAPASAVANQLIINGGSTFAVNSNNNQTGANPSSPVADFFTLDNGTYQSNTGGIAHTISSNKGFTLGAGGGTLNTSTAVTTFGGVITGSGNFTETG